MHRCKLGILHAGLRVRLVHRLTGLSPLVKYLYWPFQGGASFVDNLCYFCLVMLCFHSRLFVTCWERADLLALVCNV